ncbi:PREDICTED: uncharacterized protein LOC109583316 isoform X2 [Amphimedon queenslandica]|uniref:VWFA domain-containing protein n=1 Tax=Amphimedon queenslandica TaxID=400682 RepID=A0AAN0JBL7_AMPQE|nr:PREDICTED: uncharacterized protein LOC109583316 isoform X2 [Amphimedon queenslandica]|eukprot:XP_019854167.1 PREDICTED: uncharacterized protein LOC109583316 isoform X2 [Amphimedon queenslandica]
MAQKGHQIKQQPIEESEDEEYEQQALIFQYLSKSRVNKDTLWSVIIPHIMSMGFSTVDDLQDLEMKYLDNNDITPLDKDRIIKVVSSSKSLEAFTNQVSKAAQQDKEDTIYIRYILCSRDLFSNDIKESTIEDIKRTTPLKDIIAVIYDNSNVAANEVAELYSGEGYPLHSNELTNEESLMRWGIDDGDLFYVLIRKKDQPGQLQFATLPKVDYDIGQESFIVETPFMKDFTVNAYIDSDSPEDIAQKIYSITNIPVPYMSLYVRKGCHFGKLNTFTELNDDDIIRVVLRNPQEVATPRSRHYGSRSYNPLVPQTNEGISKFFSILKFLCSVQTYNKEYKFEKLLCYMLKITEFPPLVHALYTLKEQSFLTIAGWTALIEGCYCLFKAILSHQIHVSDDEVFEFSDYTWGLLIHLSKEITEINCVEFNQVSLVCPLSEKRIQTPIHVVNNSDLGPFDKTNILSAPQSLSNYGIDFEVTGDILIEDEDTARYLMYYPWENDDKIFVWENPPKPDISMTCKKVCVQYSLDMITDSLSELCIVHPHGLFAGNECLTYINRGQLVYFLGAAKGTDEKRRLYNPVSSNEEYILSLSKAELMTIGHQQLKEFVSHDLTANLKAISGIYSPQELTITRLSAVIEPQESIQWEPEEAIVVLLDHSGSMGSAVYSELPNLRRIDAAKELFNAFATRTQAYKLHHAFGLTVFDHGVETTLALTKNVENFEDSLKGVEPSGGTEIPTAIINAVTQLSRYSCMKRILCLTDGDYDASYESAFNFVKAYNVVVDTVLLMEADVTNKLKALSHASGGVCIRPRSMQEALKFFELDSVLSLRERQLSYSYAGM